METFIAIIHVLTALTLIALVLLQDSKSSGLGGAFGGGGSNSILGATGGATLAQKLTRGAAVVFAATSISLTLYSNKQGSVIDELPAAPASTAPATTEQGAPAGATNEAASPATTTPEPSAPAPTN